MESHPTIKLPPGSAPLPQQPRRSRKRQLIIPAITFLAGITFGLVAVLIFLLGISGDRQSVSTPLPPQTSDLVAQAGRAYITHLVERDLRASGMGNVQNVQVTLEKGDQITIEGDDQLVVFTRHFVIVVQPFIEDCQLKMRVLHADLAGIPITGFVASFEGRINQELQAKSGSLPSGFEYCKTSVRTDPQGLYITFSAKPL
jgi:hypothetical protein